MAGPKLLDCVFIQISHISFAVNSDCLRLKCNCFSNSKKEICRGGRYLTSKGEYAVGSTFYLNQFFQFNKKSKNKNKRVLISFKDLLNKDNYKLRKKGWVTIQNFDKKNDIKIAKLNNCKFILKDGKVKKI